MKFSFSRLNDSIDVLPSWRASWECVFPLQPTRRFHSTRKPILKTRSNSWEGDRLASQEYLRTFTENEFHYRIPNNPPMVPILSQVNAAHTLRTYSSTSISIWSYVLVFQAVSSLNYFQLKFYMHFSHLQCDLHALFTSYLPTCSV
jgi:hypothetical protein